MDKLNQPLVSIVFTSYNHQEYLKQALDSLVNQTYSNTEIIIIDDCSTDGSQEILNKYRSFTNIKLHLQTTNSGSYVKASNLGATFATGDYILFAQCDDFSENTQVEKLVNGMQSNPSVGVVFSKSNLVDSNGIVFSNDYINREKSFKINVSKNPFITKNQMRAYLSYSCVIPNLSAALIKHDLFKEIGCFSENFLVVADWELWLNLAEKTNFFYIDQPLNNFRQHSTTIRSKIKFETQIIEIYSLFYSHIKKYPMTNNEMYLFKIGAGSIWASYFLTNKIIWLKSFFKIHYLLKKFEKNNLFYLLIGVFKKIANSL